MNSINWNSNLKLDHNQSNRTARAYNSFLCNYFSTRKTYEEENNENNK
jgi:hypothetical protein